jgi:F0F1-type ATP synthase assembly protein I
MEKKKESKTDWTALSSLYQFAIVILSNIMVMGFIGYLLYRFAGMGKIWISFFLLFGALAGIYNGIRYLLKEAEKYDRDKNNGSKSGDDSGNSGND